METRNHLCKIFEDVIGRDDQQNTVLYHPPLNEGSRSNEEDHLIFFPGDVQDFKDQMKENPTAKPWTDWSYEDTVRILSGKFKCSHVWLVVPSKKIYKTFCVYKNFVKSESIFGVPSHKGEYGGLLHLRDLFFNLLRKVHSEESTDIKICLSLIGFSKGCIVLNQFLHEVAWYTKHLQNSADYTETQKNELKNFIQTICQLYWLDGGHSGQKDIWVRSQEILTPLKCGLWANDLKLFIHVTPYQMNDPIHPWKREEEEDFITGLGQLQLDFVEKLHFHEDSESNDDSDSESYMYDKEDLLAKHFMVIREF